MKWLCLFSSHKWIHITDVITGTNNFQQPIRMGLWQCQRCKELSRGRISNQPMQPTLNSCSCAHKNAISIPGGDVCEDCGEYL